MGWNFRVGFTIFFSSVSVRCGPVGKKPVPQRSILSPSSESKWKCESPNDSVLIGPFLQTFPSATLQSHGSLHRHFSSKDGDKMLLWNAGFCQQRHVVPELGRMSSTRISVWCLCSDWLCYSLSTGYKGLLPQDSRAWSWPFISIQWSSLKCVEFSKSTHTVLHVQDHNLPSY
jgi:hypothetical protein